MRLSLKMLRDFSVGLESLYRPGTLEEIRCRVPFVLGQFIPSDYFGYTEIGENIIEIGYPAFDATPFLDRFVAHIDEHPMLPKSWKTYFKAVQPVEFGPVAEGAAYRMTDFANIDAWRKTALYNEYFRELGLTYQVGIWGASMQTVAISANRTDRDFTDDEVALMSLYGVHIRQALGQARAFSQAGAQISSMQDALESMPLLEVNDGGRIVFCTRTAEALLKEFFPENSSRVLPNIFRQWVIQCRNRETLPPPVIQKENATLEISCQNSGDHNGFMRILLIRKEKIASAHSLEAHGISKREAEVLFWLTHGKTRKEISAILGVSLATVNKHHENMFRKLGVGTATAAVAMATRA